MQNWLVLGLCVAIHNSDLLAVQNTFCVSLIFFIFLFISLTHTIFISLSLSRFFYCIIVDIKKNHLFDPRKRRSYISRVRVCGAKYSVKVHWSTEGSQRIDKINTLLPLYTVYAYLLKGTARGHCIYVYGIHALTSPRIVLCFVNFVLSNTEYIW